MLRKNLSRSMLLLCLLSLLVATDATTWPRVANVKVCFGDLGCFTNTGPFQSGKERPFPVLPKSLPEIGIKFLLYSRNRSPDGVELKVNDPNGLTAAQIDGTLPFKFVVHGFKTSAKPSNFLKRFKQAFLARSRVNVILVTWTKGASMSYQEAAANARVVGAELAALIRLLQKKVASFDVSKVHLIGHSLGAHICGYAGERIQSPKLGRITGLDPAGPYFFGTEPVVRLDRSDATFVDTVHTNGGNILNFKLGIFSPIGHANFYVNGGRSQPGCHLTFMDAARGIFNYIKGSKKMFKKMIKKFGCSHNFAHRIFEYTISPYSRPLTAYRCINYQRFLTGDCLDCSRPGRCVPFGLQAKQPAASGYQEFFLQTGVEPQYYGTHLGFKFAIAGGTKKRQGKFFVGFNYKSGTASKDLTLPADEKWFKLKPRRTIKSLAFLPGQMKAVQSINFRWKRHNSVWRADSWFGNGKTRISRIKVFNALTQETTSFCTKRNLRAKRTYKVSVCLRRL